MFTGQLIEAESGHHVWAERFDATLEDMFDLHDRLTESIVNAIEPNVRRAEIERVRVKPTSDLQAYDLMMRALPGVMPAASAAARDEALDFIRRALEKDPRYALAKGLGASLCTAKFLLDGGDVDCFDNEVARRACARANWLATCRGTTPETQRLSA
jgi:adenylate cyclase